MNAPPQTGLGSGVTFGIVTAVNPDNPLLVKVSLDDMETGGDTKADVGYWCECMTPAAGNGRGLYAPPREGDRVVVAFYNGHPSRGVVLGCLWGLADTETHKPPVTDDAKRPITALAATAADPKKGTPGHRIVLDDTSGKEAIHIIDRTGKNSVVIDSANNALLITIEGDITIKAKTSVTVDCADGSVSWKCKTFAVEAGDGITLEGGKITAKASDTMALTGSGGVTVDGELNVNNNALKVTK